MNEQQAKCQDEDLDFLMMNIEKEHKLFKKQQSPSIIGLKQLGRGRN
jgi:hypothetical protein